MGNDIKRAQRDLDNARKRVEETAKAWRDALRTKAPAGQTAKAKALNTRAIEDEMKAEGALKRAIERTTGTVVNISRGGTVGIQAHTITGGYYRN